MIGLLIIVSCLLVCGLIIQIAVQDRRAAVIYSEGVSTLQRSEVCTECTDEVAGYLWWDGRHLCTECDRKAMEVSCEA